jgi:membrane-associated protease RseP (regulator of RpoE activity)
MFRNPGIRFVFFLLLTLVFTTLAGAEWMSGNFWFDVGQPGGPLKAGDFWKGLQFSLPFLGVLTVHEFGHYLFAKKYKADVSLPLYIPAWLGFLGIQSLGTMGAFIRLKSRLKSRTEYFDVGVAGPLAGFVAAFFLLWYGYSHLPELDYLFGIHPDYARFGNRYADFVYQNPGQNLLLGKSLLIEFFEHHIPDRPELIPNGYELMHYPFLFAGYLSLFFTALNLMPVGQLDGGHILFSACGPAVHRVVSPVIFCAFMFYAGLGAPMPVNFGYDPWLLSRLGENLFLLGMLYLALSRVFKEPLSNLALALSIFGLQCSLKILFPELTGNQGWIIFGLVLGRFLGIYHPDVEDASGLSPGRILIAVISLLVFLVCFIPRPFG